MGSIIYDPRISGAAMPEIVPIRDTITIARAQEGRSATKTYDTTGKTADYDLGYLVRGEEVEIGDLTDLYDALERLEDDPRACVMRGRPLRAGEEVRRTYLAHHEPGFARCDRSWVMLDLDARDWLAEALYEAETQLERDHLDEMWCTLYHMATRRPWKWLDALLPCELRGYGAILQWSASAGIKEGISAHVWLLLDRAVDGRSLKAWLKSIGVADLSPMNPVQPHYVARPRFVGGARDPHPVRLLMRDGPRVVLPSCVVDGATYEAQAARQLEEARAAVRARMDAAAPRLRELAGGYPARALRRACDAIMQAGEGARHETIRKEAWATYRFVAQGEMHEHEWREQLEAAAHAVLEERRWRDVTRLLDGAKQGR